MSTMKRSTSLKNGKRPTEILPFIFESVFIIVMYTLIEMKMSIH